MPDVGYTVIHRTCRAPSGPDRGMVNSQAPRRMIVERRPPWRPDASPEWTTLPVARLRYSAVERTWTLYARDRHLRFHRCDRLPPSAMIDDLLREIERDPTGIFWG